MKKAMKILFLVGGIVSAVTAASILVPSIYYLVLSSPGLKETIIQGLEDGTINSTFPGDNIQQAEAIQALFLGLAVASFIHVGLCLVSCLFSFLGRVKENKAIYILNIIFGSLSLVIVNVVAAIFGLIIQKQESSSTTSVEEIDE